jgi:hypothetical protein
MTAIEQLVAAGYEQVGLIHVNGLGWHCHVQMKDGRRFLSNNSHEKPAQAVAMCRELIAENKYEGNKR